MPTYQYACTECGHRFETVQAFTDASLTECPQCGGHLRKVYGSVGVVFKGSGFYRTDSRAGAGKASGLAAENGSSKSGDGASGSSDSGSKAAKPAVAASAGSGNGSGSSSGSSSSSTAKAAAS